MPWRTETGTAAARACCIVAVNPLPPPPLIVGDSNVQNVPRLGGHVRVAQSRGTGTHQFTLATLVQLLIVGDFNVPAEPGDMHSLPPLACLTILTLVQLLIVGDFNVPAEPRDMHPSLGPYEESYGEEERAALAGLMAAYPGELK